MKKLLVAILFCSALFEGHTQDSLNMNLLFHWDDDSIPSYQSWGGMEQQYNEIWGWHDTATGREYGIIGTAEGTYIFDVTQTDSMFLADSMTGKDIAEIHRDYKTYGNYLYGVADEGEASLQIFDLSGLPDTAVKVYDDDEFVITSHNCFIENGRLYIVTPYVLGSSPSLRILDIATDPENPTILADFDLGPGQGDHIHDLYVRDNIGYCSNGPAGLFIFDFNDPNNVTTLGSITSYAEKGYNHSSWLSTDGKTLFFVDEDLGMGIKAYDVTDFNDMSPVSLFRSNVGAMPHNVFVLGYKLYVSYYHDGVWVFDVSDPANPATIAYYDTYIELNGYDDYQGSWGVYPYLPSGKILASDFANGFFVFSDSSVTNDPPPEGVVDNQSSGFKLFPNTVRARTFLNVPNGTEVNNITVKDATGRIVFNRDYNDRNSTLPFDFSDLENGNYFMEIQSGETAHFVRFLKK